MKKLLKIGAAIAIVVALGVWFGNDAIRALTPERQSKSIGTASDGSLRDGVRLPSSGPNFSTYSRLGSLLGRTSAHHQVVGTTLDAYESLQRSHPHVHWVFGESGWPNGGPFWPHRTHQNGMVIDYMTPVRDGDTPTTLSTWPWDAFGYRHDFDERGRSGSLAIDFEAIAAHLAALDNAAKAHGLRIRKVILAPELRRQMTQTEAGQRVKHLPYSRKPVWVRHDDHYHVEFAPR